MQVVRIHDIISEQYPVSFGVPQEGHLNSLLFIFFINSISWWITKAKILLFAFGIKIYLRINSPADYLLLQAEFGVFCDWVKRLGLTLNLI